MMYGYLVLCSCVAYASAMVCLPTYCDTVMCAPVTACNGNVKVGGSFCGCCDVCMTQLGEGDSCWGTLSVGMPPRSECGVSLQCDPMSAKCVHRYIFTAPRAVVEGPCLARLHQIQASQQSGMPLIGVQEPRCDATGHYAPVQCYESVYVCNRTGLGCHCVDSQGQKLQTYQDDIGNLASMDCQCAVDQAAYMATGLIGKLFYCDTNGNYKMYRRTVAAGGSQLAGRQATAGMHTCAQALRAQQMSAPLLGRPTIECDYDGYYRPRQCSGSVCYCVRKNGTKIDNYSAPIAEKFQMTCQCARDKARYESIGMADAFHKCTSHGNYQQYQCTSAGCFCVDYHGKINGTRTVPIADIGNLNC